MAVYERTYKRYTGPITPQLTRFLVLPRYIFKDLFKSKLLLFFFFLCLVPPFLSLCSVYLLNSLDLLDSTLFEFLKEPLSRMRPSAQSFLVFMWIQGALAFFMTIFIGPDLVSRDLANNGLPLYFARPISRAEYLLGKISVVFIVVSAITWVPGLLIFLLQGIMDDGDWLSTNLRIGFALVIGESLWALLLALIAVTCSAIMRWKLMAGFTMFMIFPMPILFDFIWTVRLHNPWGAVFDPIHLINIVWTGLLGVEPLIPGPPVAAAWVALLAITGGLAFVLHMKLRAYEVIS